MNKEKEKEGKLVIKKRVKERDGLVFLHDLFSLSQSKWIYVCSSVEGV